MSVIDLRNTKAARDILSTFHGFDLGNKGHTDVESLTLDTDTGWVSGKVTVVAKHKWGDFTSPTDPLGGKKDIAATHKMPCDFQYNPQQNEIKGTLKLASIKLSVEVLGIKYENTLAEIKVNLKRIKQILEGNMMAFLELIAGPAGEIVKVEPRDEWKAIKDSFEAKYPGNVYVASKGLVDWASPEKLGEWFGEWFVTGGAAVTAAMQEVKSKALQELAEVVDWLQKKVGSEASTMANKILTGAQVEWPSISLKVGWQTFKYESRRLIAGKPVTPWIPVRHGGFVLIWTSGTVSSPIPPSVPHTSPGDDGVGDSGAGGGGSGGSGPPVGSVSNPDPGTPTGPSFPGGADPGTPIDD